MKEDAIKKCQSQVEQVAKFLECFSDVEEKFVEKYKGKDVQYLDFLRN